MNEIFNEKKVLNLFKVGFLIQQSERIINNILIFYNAESFIKFRILLEYKQCNIIYLITI